MAEYQNYTDQNRVSWRVFFDAKNATARISDESNPIYEQADVVIGPVELHPSNILTDFIDEHILETEIPSASEIADRQRKAFVELRGMIEDYAKAHKSQVVHVDEVIDIHGKAPDGGGWVLLGLAIALAMSE